MTTSPFSNPQFQLAVVGGGQLGKMLVAEARRMDISVHILDPSADAPAQFGAQSFTQGSFLDFDTVVAFGRQASAVTIELEAVNVDALEQLEKEGIPVYPESRVLRLLQNKPSQKDTFQKAGIPTSAYESFPSVQALHQARESGKWPLPFVWKIAMGGYDGFGVTIVKTEEQAQQLPVGPCLVEECVSIALEVAVQVARHPNGTVAVYPVCDMEFHPTANQVEFVLAPTALSSALAAESQSLALRTLEALDMHGLLSVELFYTTDGNLLVNEVAPRPHNSGHWTLEGAATSQFEQLLRLCADLPLGSTELLHPAAMANLVGAEGYSGPVFYEGVQELMAMPLVYLHVYGKSHTRSFRKMGHLTALGATRAEARSRAEAARDAIRVVTSPKF